jgi:hypothetical protein
MKKAAQRSFGSLVVVFLLCSTNGRATIIVGVPASRALVICADRLQSIENSNPSVGAVPSRSTTKIHQLGTRTVWASAGNISTIKSDHTVVYDADALVKEFFSYRPLNNDGTVFDEFEAFLRARILKRLELIPGWDLPPEGIPPNGYIFDLVFFWVDTSGNPHEHFTRVFYKHPRRVYTSHADALPQEFLRVKPFVTGSGYVFYRELEQGTDDQFAKWRKDRELRILIDGTLPSKRLSPSKAEKLIRKIIAAASRGGALLQPSQNFSEGCDCVRLPYRGPLAWHLHR